MEVTITLTELGENEKLRSIKSVMESLEIGLLDAKLLVDAILENETIVKEIERLPKSTEYVKYSKKQRPRKRFPREMMVSYTGKIWRKATVFGKVKVGLEYFYLSKLKPNGMVLAWSHAKEIDL